MIRRTLMGLLLSISVGGALAACNSTPAATSTLAPVPTSAPASAPSSEMPSEAASSAPSVEPSTSP